MELTANRTFRRRLHGAGVALALVTCGGPTLYAAQQRGAARGNAQQQQQQQQQQQAARRGPGQEPQQPAQARQPTQAPAAAPRAPGLDGLSDDALFSELATRGQDRLLERAFDANNIPASRRAGFKALPALRELADAPQRPPTAARRRQLLDSVAQGVDPLLASVADPRALMEYATVLIREGVQQDVNIIEYWGEAEENQRRLRPVIEAVVKMLDRAAELAEARRAEVEKKLDGPASEAAAKQWSDADQLYNTAVYTRQMLAYNLALSVPANTPQGRQRRAEIADAAVQFLKDYDNEESGIQAAVANRVAKLHLVKADYAAAKAEFRKVIDGKTKPPPSPFEQYEARYFTLAAELGAANAPAVRKGLDELIAWHQQALPLADNKPLKEGVESAAEMLRYRTTLLEEKLANDPGAKQAARDAALAILINLYERYPALRDVINDQLVATVSPTANVKELRNPLLLNALVQRAVDEQREPGDRLDAAVLDKGIEAARELLASKDPKVTPQMALQAEAAVPALLEKLGEQDLSKKVAAANAYMDYVDRHKSSATPPRGMQRAFRQAGYLTISMMSDPKAKTDAQAIAAYDRFLPLAIGKPFNRVDLALEYARRLYAEGKARESLQYFRLVPRTDPNYANARYRMMGALQDLLYAREKGQPIVQGPERQKMVEETLALTSEVKQAAQAGLTSQREPERRSAQVRFAGATLVAAELLSIERPPNWPQQLLQALNGFEQRVQGLAGVQGMLDRVLQLRVNAFMESKQFDQATAALLALLEKSGGEKGADVVRGLLEQLNREFDAARAADDDARERTLADNIANLSKFLVQWAATNKNADIRKYTYRYKVFDADAQRQAATLEPDAAKRRQRLAEAMQRFQELRSPDNLKLYQAGLTDPKADPNEDPAVTLGVARTHYDLGEWRQANELLRRLKGTFKLGNPKNRVEDPKSGEVKYVDNPTYWEGTYKLIRSAIEWAKSEPANADAQKELEAAKTRLKREYVRDPKDVGGEAWRAQFEELRKQLTPEFDPARLAAPTGGQTAQR
jgi:hypothetical protein